ncbi:YrzI family small protein [Salipaludibacillus sp. CF4.18]|uniref:YrzI family small protein n=1 Tax=Salipaludibacillus sp. CF4.18 TaxID=3373081 RepID=UPI003EE5A85E
MRKRSDLGRRQKQTRDRLEKAAFSINLNQTERDEFKRGDKKMTIHIFFITIIISRRRRNDHTESQVDMNSGEERLREEKTKHGKFFL